MTPHPMFRPLALCAVLGLGACSSPASDPQAGAAPPPAPPPTQVSSGQAPRNQCAAEAAQQWVGQAYAPALLDEALRASGADVARVLRADSMITKEYQAGRLNLVLDASGQRIARAYCG